MALPRFGERTLTFATFNLEKDGGPDEAGRPPRRWAEAHEQILAPLGLGRVRAIFEDQPAASDAVHRKAEDRPRTGRTRAIPTTQRGAVAVVVGPTRSPGQGLDVLFRQEATYSGLDGRRRLHAAERTLGMRGFLGEARISRNPNALFVRPGVLDVLEEYEHRDPWRAPPANVVARLEGTGRIREAEEILAVADKMKQGLGFAGGGDCNEYPFPAGETVREIDWSTVTDRPHMMHRTIQGPDGRRTSRTAVDELLLGAGLHDPARHAALHLDRPRALDATAGHTPSMDGQGGSRRIDHLYFDLWLVQAVLDVQVVDCSGASDHNAVVATLSYRKAAEALSRAFDPLAPLDLIVAGG